MSSDFIVEFKKANTECTFACFLSFMQKHMPLSPTTHQERMTNYSIKLLFWKFVEIEFFEKSKLNRSSKFLQRILEDCITEVWIFNDILLKTPFESKESYFRVKSAFLTLIGKLNSHILSIQNPEKSINYRVSIQTQNTLDLQDTIIAKYIKMGSTKIPIKDSTYFLSPEFQKNFFLKHNNDYCQICSITDTLNDNDFFIFCEVS